MKCSLIITTYNWPEALSLVLSSVFGQTSVPDEVIIADDGSENTTKNIIEKFKWEECHAPFFPYVGGEKKIAIEKNEKSESLEPP